MLKNITFSRNSGSNVDKHNVFQWFKNTSLISEKRARLLIVRAMFHCFQAHILKNTTFFNDLKTQRFSTISSSQVLKNITFWMISTSNAEKHNVFQWFQDQMLKNYVFGQFQAQMFKNLTFFNDFKLKCGQTQWFSMI